MSDIIIKAALKRIATLEGRLARSEKMEFGTSASLLAAGFALASEIPTSSYVLIADSGILAADAASVDFQNIPQTYTHLRLTCSLRSDRAAATNDSVLVRYNNDSGSNYDYIIVVESSTAATRVQTLATTSMLLGYSTAATSVASDFNAMTFDIPSYANGSINKDGIAIGTRRDSAGGFYHTQATCHYRQPTAISRITVLPGVGTNWKQYSRITLHGVL